MKTSPTAPATDGLLVGSDLPARWAGRDRFVILEAGFGLGHDFIAAWEAWRLDAARCRRLVFVGIEAHPPTRSELEHAHGGSECSQERRTLAAALAQAWPPLTPNLHNLDFEAGRVRLVLAFGDLRALLPRLSLRADAFLLAGPAPASDPAPWTPQLMKALGRRAAPQARAASWNVTDELHAGLAAAGFEVDREPRGGGGRQMTRARYCPRFLATAPPPVPTVRHAVVVGAGLAGAATARALADEGWSVTVLDRQPIPAAETSGNAGGLFHGTVHADDGPHARLLRAAALQAERSYRPLVACGAVPGQVAGLLRLDARPIEALQALIDRQSLPSDWVQALDAAQASARVGIAVPSSAWFFPGGGWVAPAALVAHWLASDGVCFVGSAAVHRLQQCTAGWRLIGDAGRLLAEAPVVVLANAADAQRLLAPWRCAWPLQRIRGQVSGWQGAPTPLALPLAGDGYALPLAGGGILCGATSRISVEGDDDDRVSASDHQQNFLRLLRLTGLHPPPDRVCWQGRVGWRLQSEDRLPLAGAVPQPEADGRRDQPRLWPRIPGLFVCTALGGRGLTMAPLLGRLLAGQITGGPLPLEQGLVDAVDPVRFRVRAARREAPV